MSYIQILYYAAVLYSLLFLINQIRVNNNSLNITFFLVLVSVLVSNCGNAWLVSSTTVEEGLACMKTNYLATIPLCYFTFLLIADTCKININKILIYILGIIAILIVGFSMTIGRSTVFYESAELVLENGYAYLVKVYGPMHISYVIFVIAYMLGAFGVAIYALFKPSLVARLMAVSLAMAQFFCIFIYLLERHLELKIELLPFAYCVVTTVYGIVLKRRYLYDADRVSNSIRQSNRDSAVILFDKAKRYIGNNETAGILFSELNSYYVERPISDKYEGKKYFERLIDDFETIATKDGEAEVHFRTLENYQVGDVIYNVRVGRLVNETISGDRGYIIEFVDDTVNQNYIRTINEMNAELEKAAKDAEAASESKSRFLASMSHEIRTPINAVLGFNSIILRDTKESAIRDYASDIDRAGKSLLSLINDILDFSKVEAGKIDIKPVEYKLENLIMDCQGMMHGRIKEKGLDFAIECDDTCPSVLLGDETRIRQVVINLLTNAYKYTEQGSIMLGVGYKTISSDEIMLTIRVDDTGVGISEEDQAHLFERFTRVDDDKTRNIEGTGLGLALVQSFSELMGGNISVSSKLGEGSSFIVNIPQKVISSEPIGNNKFEYERKEQSVRMDDLINTEGTVLVVDDVNTNLKVFKMMLSKSKLTIDTALSGLEALQMSKERKYDIIFLDHMMPGMDGIETLRKMKEDTESVNINTPVVMLTANAIEGVKEQYMNEGFDDYLSKPINFTLLKDTIFKFIGQGHIA